MVQRKAYVPRSIAKIDTMSLVYEMSLNFLSGDKKALARGQSLDRQTCEVMGCKMLLVFDRERI